MALWLLVRELAVRPIVALFEAEKEGAVGFYGSLGVFRGYYTARCGARNVCNSLGGVGTLQVDGVDVLCPL